MDSRLLKLPREIRDLIYEFALVRDVILIERGAATISEGTASHSPEFYRRLTKSHPLTRSRTHRRMWLIPRFDLGLTSYTCDPEDPPSHVQMTYQLTDQCDGQPQDRINICLLQTCQQVYHEARKVFYGKNRFRFPTAECIPTAFAFLCDRPAESLKLISTIDVTLSEGHNLRGTGEAHYPAIPRSTDSLVLRYAYNHFTDLCTLLSTSRMHLRKLYLTIDSLHQLYNPVLPSPADCRIWEAAKMSRPRPWVAPWVDPLLKLDNLECLDIHWIFDRPEMCRMADTMSLMRQQMLVRRQAGQAGSPSLCCKPSFDFRINYRISTPDQTSVCCEVSKKDLLRAEDQSGATDSQPSEGRLKSAWREHMREIIEASGCL